MKRLLVIALPAFFLGFVLGNAFWYLASPLWIDRVVDEDLPAELMLTPLAEGRFRDADAAHQGSGVATLYATAGGAYLLRLSDFEVTNGPDLEVWLSAAADPVDSAAVGSVDFLSLGPLKGNIGDQTYFIPEGTDLASFASVVIWCEQFSVMFSPATLVAPK